jgi:uncharacterized membrane protein HdeD (DUF308 family)
MFARVLGPYFLFVPAMVAARASYMKTLLSEFAANPMWPWLYGAILLIAGLVIIAFHQYWRGAAAILVSLLGWFLAIRGVLLMAVPQPVTSAGEALTGPVALALVRVFFVGLALVGLYLTYVGWRPEPATAHATKRGGHATGN